MAHKEQKTENKEVSHVRPKDINATVGHDVKFQAVVKVSKQLLILAFLGSVVWNVISPLKSWMLSDYKLLDLAPSDNIKMQWHTKIDGVYADRLYENAGIKRGFPGKWDYFVNIYTDFVVHEKSTNWAHLLNNNVWDEYVGKYCRLGLKPNREKQLEVALSMNETGYIRTKFSTQKHYFLDEEDCPLNGVPEALLCMKNINATQLLNLGSVTNRKEDDPEVVEALTWWQDTYFPSLNACFDRRRQLLTEYSYKEALITLSKELSSNYSLRLENTGGSLNIYKTVIHESGFTDFSGKVSGSRKLQMQGEMYTRSTNQIDGVSAIQTAKAPFYLCTFQKAKSDTFRECLEKYSIASIIFIFGDYVISDDDDPAAFVENRLYEEDTKTGVIQGWKLKKRDSTPKPVHKLVDESKFKAKGHSAYSSLNAAMLEKVNNLETGSIRDPITFCLVRDGCISECTGPRGANWIVTYKKAGKCIVTRVPKNVIDFGSYNSEECYGVGTGESQITLRQAGPESLGPRAYTILNNTADPHAVLACILGGRIPNGEEFPAFFLDQVIPGPGTVKAASYLNGSEGTLINFYSIISLIGYFCFAIWSMHNIRMYYSVKKSIEESNELNEKQKAQISYGIYMSNFATRIWRRNKSLLRIVGFIGILSWNLGSSGSICLWSVDKLEETSQAPMYMCNSGDSLGHVGSFIEIIRLGSYSYIFYAMTFQTTKALIGITRTMYGWSITVLIFGLIPAFISAVCVSLINELRIEAGMDSFHNQIFIALLWIVAIYLWTNFSQLYLNLGTRVLALCGIHRQMLVKNSRMQLLVGDYYFAVNNELSLEPIEWVPFSVFLELEDGDLDCILWKTHQFIPKYSGKEFTERIKEEGKSVPEFIQTLEDYYIH